MGSDEWAICWRAGLLASRAYSQGPQGGGAFLFGLFIALGFLLSARWRFAAMPPGLPGGYRTFGLSA
jgi:hypothetical protein